MINRYNYQRLSRETIIVILVLIPMVDLIAMVDLVSLPTKQIGRPSSRLPLKRMGTEWVDLSMHNTNLD